MKLPAIGRASRPDRRPKERGGEGGGWDSREREMRDAMRDAENGRKSAINGVLAPVRATHRP